MLYPLGNHQDPPEGIAAHPTNPERTEWSAAIVGPEDTPYSGGVFYLQLNCPPEYPLKPPTARFITKIYHCNVSNEGEVCHEILRDKWSPVLTLAQVLVSIKSLLKNPNLGFPGIDGYASFPDLKEPGVKSIYNREIAEQFKHDRTKYDQVAREWTDQHARGELGS